MVVELADFEVAVNSIIDKTSLNVISKAFKFVLDTITTIREGT